MQITQTTAATFATVWHHLDQLSDEDGNHHLNVAADSVEAVATALMADKPISRDVLVRLLAGAAMAIRKGQNDIGAAIIELGDVTQT
jgi:dsRNA-specific ribonuclease